MSDLQFNSDNATEFRRPEVSSGSDLTGLLIKWGLAKNRDQAQYVMVGIIIFFVVLSVITYRSL